jgi:hypothetical protein
MSSSFGRGHKRGVDPIEFDLVASEAERLLGNFFPVLDDHVDHVQLMHPEEQKGWPLPFPL